MKKGIIVKPDIKDTIEAFNDAGMKIEFGEKETDGIIVYDKGWKKAKEKHHESARRFIGGK